jgi:hypothetical protein
MPTACKTPGIAIKIVYQGKLKTSSLLRTGRRPSKTAQRAWKISPLRAKNSSDALMSFLLKAPQPPTHRNQPVKA